MIVHIRRPDGTTTAHRLTNPRIVIRLPRSSRPAAAPPPERSEADGARP